jgi:hypothetical protein
MKGAEFSVRIGSRMKFGCLKLTQYYIYTNNENSN